MPFIRLHDVSVEFPILSADSTSLRAQIVNIGSGGILKRDARNNMSIVALNRLRLKIEKGDRIGLLGRNGAGKSTLLRLLAGIITPTSGNVRVSGTIAALLGSTLGLDDDLTGHEAIKYGSMLMGMSRQDAQNAAPDIAAFTELGDYLSMPVRTYSSGMRLRLSFAIATCRQPDILLVDEMIGAGDAHFVEKAKRRATEFMSRSSIVVLASHSEDIVRTVCDKAVLLEKGSIVIAGEIEEVLRIYRENDGIGGRVAVSPAIADRAISSGASPGRPATFALDGNIATHWESLESGNGVVDHAAIGIDLGEGQAREAQGFTIRQWYGGDVGTTVSRVRVEASEDGFQLDIRNVDTLSISPSINRASYRVSPSGPSRFWRLIAAAPTEGGPWAVVEIQFLYANSEALLAANRGQPFANGHTGGNTAKCAFDGWKHTFWCAAQRGDEVKGVSYIGYDFGPHSPVEIRRFKLQQWDGGARPNTISSVRVQLSSDAFGSEIDEAGTIAVSPDALPHLHHLAPTRPARYWRLLANTPTRGGHWGISVLEFSDQDEPNFSDDASADSIAQGTVVSGGDFQENGCTLAFDGEPDTHWISVQSGPYLIGAAFVGYDFGPGQTVHVRRFVIQQWNSGEPPNLIDSAVVECSNDGFRSDIMSVATIPIGCLTMRVAFDLPPSKPARFWRIVANSTTGHGDGRWGITHVEFWDESKRRAGRPPRLLS